MHALSKERMSVGIIRIILSCIVLSKDTVGGQIKE